MALSPHHSERFWTGFIWNNGIFSEGASPVNTSDTFLYDALDLLEHVGIFLIDPMCQVTTVIQDLIGPSETKMCRIEEREKGWERGGHSQFRQWFIFLNIKKEGICLVTHIFTTILVYSSVKSPVADILYKLKCCYTLFLHPFHSVKKAPLFKRPFILWKQQLAPHTGKDKRLRLQVPCWVASLPHWHSGRCTTRSHPLIHPSMQTHWNLDRDRKHGVYSKQKTVKLKNKWDWTVTLRQEKEDRCQCQKPLWCTHRLTSLCQSSCYFILGGVDVAGCPSALSS